MNKTLLTALGIGALIGGFFTSWLAPKVIAWYFEPPVEIGVNCRPATEWAMAKLQMLQGLGLIAGAIVGAIIYFVVMQRRNRV